MSGKTFDPVGGTGMTRPAHTALPWTEHYDDNGFYYVVGEDMPSPYIVATGGEGDTNKANAALIVRAVNCHDDLVKALEECSILLGGLPAAKNNQRVTDAQEHQG